MFPHHRPPRPAWTKLSGDAGFAAILRRRILALHHLQLLPAAGNAAPEWRRDLLLETLEQVRHSYKFILSGYVVMPEHVHLLVSEPERGDPSVVMQVLKQRFVRMLLRTGPGLESQPGIAPLAAGTVWQRRFYDFVVWTERKRIEKLRYMHRNPVTRGLVSSPEQWKWSSYRHYAFGEPGPVLVNEARASAMKVSSRAAEANGKSALVPASVTHPSHRGKDR